MNSKKSLTIALAALLFALILPAAALAVAVTVECAYTTGAGDPDFGDVYCKIFVDTTGTAGLLSGGIALSSNNLTAVSATKNTDVWFFGDAAPGIDYPNSPDISDPANPIVITGHLDTSSSPTVVSGTRVEMGSVTFSRTDDTLPNIVPQLAKSGSYINFVDVDGALLDDTITINAAVINKLGDANADGNVTPGDSIAIRNFFFNGDPLVNQVAADCNQDGSVTPGDSICVRNIFFGM